MKLPSVSIQQKITAGPGQLTNESIDAGELPSAEQSKCLFFSVVPIA